MGSLHKNIVAAGTSLLVLQACGSGSDPQAPVPVMAQTSNESDLAMLPPPPPPPPNYAPAIEAAIAADDRTSSHGINMSRATAMRAIDLSQTPTEFREAYLEHIFAWERGLRARRAFDGLATGDNRGQAVAATLACALIDCRTNPINSQIEAEERLQEEIRLAQEQIRSTFQEVQRIAVRHGANPTAQAGNAM